MGENHEDIHNKYLHTAGNLTLSGYNSEYKDKSFKEKRDMKGGFKQSPLKLNEGLGDLESFGEDEMRRRAEKLADSALKIWVSPTLDSETLMSYKPKKEKIEEKYSIESYRFSPYSKELFEILDREIMTFDENITRSFTKKYVAYKLDTNFVDVVVLQKELKLYLNIKAYELQDEKNMARDVSNIGSWGNGDVEVKLKTKNDIPYCLGLIRQALQKQL